jgi:H+/Cl- antiporter ClcA
MGVHGEHFNVGTLPEVNWLMIVKVVAISVIAAVVSIFFCKAMHGAHHFFGRIKNEYLRAIIGGAIIIALTLLAGNSDYNGGGLHIIEAVFNEGNVEYEAFLLKIVFTAITIGAGFKGGEIVPTLFIGATLGGAVGSIIGLPIPFAAALGIAALFCGVTNCPLATVLLCFELFGQEGLIFYVLSAFLSFSLSGYYSLYTGQKIVFSKISDEIIDQNGH